MSAPATGTTAPAAGERQPAWRIQTHQYERRVELTVADRDAITGLGWQLRRRRGYDHAAPEWHRIGWLLRPLDDAVTGLHWSTDTRAHRSFADDAIALVLLRCAESGRTFWGWSADDWVALIGTSIEQFREPWPLRIDATVRPYTAALAYLIGRFTDFDRLGPFGRQVLARRVFGSDAVEEVTNRVTGMLTGWGYRIGPANSQRLSTALVQAMLINRSTRLEDLTTDVFDRLRRDHTMGRRHSHALHSIQKVVAALGFCDPRPVAPSNVRYDIEGTPTSWSTSSTGGRQPQP
ncbi:hypothetical protein ACFPIJ_47165 [Dactylosporangium cerinum]|uniref:Uncharacterized protein n=1 Tax=Dactylosporangium cerinum TaxID=1434730 RepID=A0ABV9WDP4_9ACTN